MSKRPLTDAFSPHTKMRKTSPSDIPISPIPLITTHSFKEQTPAEMKSDVKRLSDYAKSLEAKNALNESQIARLEAILRQLQDKHEKLQIENESLLFKAKCSQQSSEVSGSSLQNFDAIISDFSQTEKLRREFEDLQAEVIGLRAWKLEHMEVEEKYISTKLEIQRYKDRVEELYQYEAMYTDLRVRFDEFEIALQTTEVPTVSRVLSTLSELRNAIVQLESDKTELRAQLALSKDHASELSSRLTQAAGALELKEELERARNENLQLKAENELLVQSRQNLQSLISSISSDDSRFSNSSDLSSQLAEYLAASDQMVSQRLSSVIAEKEVIAKEKNLLEKELLSLKSSSPPGTSSASTVCPPYDDFDPSKTKILHFSINPSSTSSTSQLAEKLSQASDSLPSGSANDEVTEALKSKIRALQKEVLLLKSSIGHVKEKNEKEVETLKRMFQQKSHQLFLCVRMIFGWEMRFDKADKNPKQRTCTIKWRSPSSMDDVYELDFSVWTETGEVELLDGPFAQTLMATDGVLDVLQRQRIPGFLSFVTLHVLSPSRE
jgi:hypothetical protein